MYYLYSFLISFLTLSYASLASFREENFTGIANNLNHQVYFKVWVLIVSFYFFNTTLQLFKKHQWQPHYLKPVALVIFLGINLSSWIPYQKNSIHLNALHILCAVGPSVLYLVLLQLFINDLRFFKPALYQKLSSIFQMLLFTLVVLLLAFGNVNSLVEIVLVCGFSFFVAYALKQENKN